MHGKQGLNGFDPFGVVLCAAVLVEDVFSYWAAWLVSTSFVSTIKFCGRLLLAIYGWTGVCVVHV